MKYLTALFVAATVLITAAAAQTPNWTEITPANSPSARLNHSMVYDSVRGKVVMFAGYAGGYLNDTWEYDGVDWTQVTPANSPSARHLHTMVYDSVRQKVVMFGGTESSLHSDTWEYDGVDWTEITTASSPSARAVHAMVYDSARQKVVVFGGNDSQPGYLNDTWEYDGVNWTEITTASSPSARYDHAMVYDSVRQKVVMFGGYDSTSNSHFNDTWEFDGVNWTEITPASSPSARNKHVMAYDSVRGKVVVFGGWAGGYVNDTWEYDGVDWTQVTTVSSPSARRNHAMAYDSARGKVVMFGGDDSQLGYFDDTWEYGCGSLALIGGLDPAVLGTANFNMTSGDTLEFNYGHCVPGSFVVLTLNINEPVATTVEIPGFEQAWAGSTPTGNMVTGFSTILPAPNTQVAVPAGIFAIGDTCRWQAVYLDFVSTPWLVVASNVIETTYIPGCVAGTEEGFEGVAPGVGNYPSGWSDGGGNEQWQSRTGTTPSSNTGPNAASEGSGYFYCETTGGLATGTTYIMTSPSFSAGSGVRFDLSRVGATIGTLDVSVDDGTGAQSIGNYTGPGISEWSTEQLDLPAGLGASYTVTFTYTRGSSFTGDIAIDAFCIF